MDKGTVIKKITTIIKQHGVQKIILFGSYAYGNPTKDSDIDLLVIKDIPEKEIRDFRIKLKKELWNNLDNISGAFDILIDNEERIKQRIALGDLFYKEIYTKGKTIYA